MTRQTLYSCKSLVTTERGDAYTVTKFVGGEVESHYTCTPTDCDCPAGVRPSCRHRQMLPQMIAAGIVNTHYFWDFDLGRAVDFNGTLKSNFDAMERIGREREQAPEASPEGAQTPEEAREAMAECDYWNGRKSLAESASEGQPQPINLTATEVDQRIADSANRPLPGDGILTELVDRATTVITTKPTSWRRL